VGGALRAAGNARPDASRALADILAFLVARGGQAEAGLAEAEAWVRFVFPRVLFGLLFSRSRGEKSSLFSSLSTLSRSSPSSLFSLRTKKQQKHQASSSSNSSAASLATTAFFFGGRSAVAAADPSLVRHFLRKLLAAVSPPHSPEFVGAVSRLLVVSGVKKRGAGMAGAGGGGGGGQAGADLGGMLAADGPSRAHLRAFARDALKGGGGGGAAGGGASAAAPGASAGAGAAAAASLGAKESALLAELRDAL
jgi:hypothetical protein